jgi:Right handed beta helix region
VGNEAANERKAVELPHVQPREAGVMGVSLNRAASRISLVIFALAVVGLMAFGDSQASASHVSCGDEIAADTTLDSDLVDCPGSGIVIGADDITLDLNGHTVDGDGTPDAGCPLCNQGLLNFGHGGVTVRDGSVREFAIGVYFNNARHNRVLGISSRRQLGSGIDVYGNKSVVVRNRVFGNGVVVDGDGSRVARNVVVRSPRYGIWVEEDGVLVARNVVVRSRGAGINLSCGDNNTVYRNRVRESGQDGFWVAPCNDHVLLKRNVAVGAEDDGFAVRSRSAKITRNRARRNGDLGIGAMVGVIDGGGNRAHGNGNPAQCRNVVCK